METVDATFCLARSLKDFATGIFKYESQVTGVSFAPDQCLPEKFRNLKKHVRRHIKMSACHVQNLRSQMEEQKEMESKNEKL